MDSKKSKLGGASEASSGRNPRGSGKKRNKKKRAENRNKENNPWQEETSTDSTTIPPSSIENVQPSAVTLDEETLKEDDHASGSLPASQEACTPSHNWTREEHLDPLLGLEQSSHNDLQNALERLQETISSHELVPAIEILCNSRAQFGEACWVEKLRILLQHTKDQTAKNGEDNESQGSFYSLTSGDNMSERSRNASGSSYQRALSSGLGEEFQVLHNQEGNHVADNTASDHAQINEDAWTDGRDTAKKLSKNEYRRKVSSLERSLEEVTDASTQKILALRQQLSTIEEEKLHHTNLVTSLNQFLVGKGLPSEEEACPWTMLQQLVDNVGHTLDDLHTTQDEADRLRASIDQRDSSGEELRCRVEQLQRENSDMFARIEEAGVLRDADLYLDTVLTEHEVAERGGTVREKVQLLVGVLAQKTRDADLARQDLVESMRFGEKLDQRDIELRQLLRQEGLVVSDDEDISRTLQDCLVRAKGVAGQLESSKVEISRLQLVEQSQHDQDGLLLASLSRGGAKSTSLVENVDQVVDDLLDTKKSLALSLQEKEELAVCVEARNGLVAKLEGQISLLQESSIADTNHVTSSDELQDKVTHLEEIKLSAGTLSTESASEKDLIIADLRDRIGKLEESKLSKQNELIECIYSKDKEICQFKERIKHLEDQIAYLKDIEKDSLERKLQLSDTVDEKKKIIESLQDTILQLRGKLKSHKYSEAQSNCDQVIDKTVEYLNALNHHLSDHLKNCGSSSNIAVDQYSKILTQLADGLSDLAKSSSAKDHSSSISDKLVFLVSHVQQLHGAISSELSSPKRAVQEGDQLSGVTKLLDASESVDIGGGDVVQRVAELLKTAESLKKEVAQQTTHWKGVVDLATELGCDSHNKNQDEVLVLLQSTVNICQSDRTRLNGEIRQLREQLEAATNQDDLSGDSWQDLKRLCEDKSRDSHILHQLFDCLVKWLPLDKNQCEAWPDIVANYLAEEMKRKAEGQDDGKAAEDLRKQLENSIRWNSEYQMRIESLESQLEEMWSDLQEDEKNKEIRVLLEEKEVVINGLKQEINRLMDINCQDNHDVFHTAAIEAEHVSPLHSSSEEVGEESKEIESLKAEIVVLTEELGNLRIADAQIDSPVSTLKEEVKLLGIEKSKIEETCRREISHTKQLTTEVDRLLSVVNSQSELLAQLNDTNKKLENELVQSRKMTFCLSEMEEEELAREAIKSLSQMVRDKEEEIEALRGKNESLLEVLNQSISGDGSMDMSHCADSPALKKLLEEREVLSRQLSRLQDERQRFLVLVHQKHEESLNFYTELTSMWSYIGQERTKWESGEGVNRELTAECNRLGSSLLSTARELDELRARFTEVSNRCQALLTERVGTGDAKHREVVGLRGELERLRSAYEEQGEELTLLKNRLQGVVLELKEVGHIRVELERAQRMLDLMDPGWRDRVDDGSSDPPSVSVQVLQQQHAVVIGQLKEDLGIMSGERDAALDNLVLCQTEVKRLAVEVQNLERALHAFQNNEAAKIAAAVEPLEKRLTEQRLELSSLSDTKVDLETRLEAQADVIEAAQRLSVQMDSKEDQLQRMLHTLENKELLIDKLNTETDRLVTQIRSKVERELLKNLLIGYFQAPAHQKIEAMHVIGKLLLFSEEDYTKLSPEFSNQSGLSGWFQWRKPPSTPTETKSESFGQLFSSYLTQESSTPNTPTTTPPVQTSLPPPPPPPKPKTSSSSLPLLLKNGGPSSPSTTLAPLSPPHTTEAARIEDSEPATVIIPSRSTPFLMAKPSTSYPYDRTNLNPLFSVMQDKR